MRRIILLTIFAIIGISIIKAQQYVVISLTGKVNVETPGAAKHELRLREKLTNNSVINLSYKAEVELLETQKGKKYTLRVPGKGKVAEMIKNKNNSVIQLTNKYLDYISARLKGNGELTSRKHSDPATVTREIATANDSFEEQYKAFQQEANNRYEQFRMRAIKDYAMFMKNAWKTFGAEPKRQQPQIKEVPPTIETTPDFTPIDSNDPIIKGKPIKINASVVPMPKPMPQPKPVKPIVEQPEETTEYVEFAVYGTPMKVRFNDKEMFTINSLTEEEIANVFEKLANANFNNTIRDCLELRELYQLGDWAYLHMLEKLAKTCFTSTNEAILFMGFIYQQSGYKMRFAIGQSGLRLLYASQHIIYNMCYYKLGNDEYYVYGDEETQLQICDAAYPNEKQMSLWLTQQPMFAETQTPQRTFTAKRYDDMSFTISTNKNLIDFYDSYPASKFGDDFLTKWAIYAATPMQEHVKQTLYPAMQQAIEGLTKREAMEKMLNWVQTSLVYEYDSEIWGYDRAFFAEETLYYPYADCEDRSILLTHLVRDLLGLKVVLIYYPGHLAMAVHFEDEQDGDYVVYRGEKFIVCDPTFIGARVGRTMPEMDNQTAQLILIN